MKSLTQYLHESLNEAVEMETTYEVKEGKNIINLKAKVVNLTGNVKYADIYFDKDTNVEAINLQGLQAECIRLDVIGCNKVREINGGTGKYINVNIQKNVKLVKVDLSGYECFNNTMYSGASYIEKNKMLNLKENDLPREVADKHGLDINNGVVFSRSNGMTGKNKLGENK